MYKISVPIMNSNVTSEDRAKVLEELKHFDAERVFLALNTYETDFSKRAKVMDALKENCEFFKKNGFEVGAWIWTFWVENNTKFRNMISISGAEITEFMCPTDEKFVEFSSSYIKDIVACGVDMIMFDDDFRYGFLSDSPACLCDAHIKEINSITGENLSREDIKNYITEGKPNIYRDAYLKANGDAFKNFARSIRDAVDQINPSVRLGACACLTSWDIDGVNAFELSKILAGNTRPFIRLIGAPYWAVNKSWGNQLQDVIELERMESSWNDDDSIEIFAEGDSYPRPRNLCPASYLEGFDTAIRASGCTDGILKYGIDYYSKVDYETGYRKAHIKNKPLYKKIDDIFSNMTSTGVRVYEFMNKVSDMVVPTKVNKTVDIHNLFFSKAARTLAYNTIPTVYEGAGVCGIVFDENARKIPLDALKNGLIMDISAAEILMERGIDVGICHIGEQLRSKSERFVYNDNCISSWGEKIYRVSVSEKAEILSYYEHEGERIPVSFRYENDKGNRFLILNTYTREGNNNLLKHYERSRQYAEEIQWLSGKKLPAYCYGNPALYIQCKKNEDSMAVGLWNFHADTVYEPIVELDGEYKEIEFINCHGEIIGDKVKLSDITPFGFVGFKVKK